MNAAGTRWLGGCLAWLLGVVLHLQQAALWPVLAYGVILVLGLFMLALGRRRMLCVVVAACLMGIGASGWRACVRWADALPEHLEGEDVLVVGVVNGLPRMGPNGLSFRFDVETAQWQGEAVRLPQQLSLGWYVAFADRPGRSAHAPQALPELKAGQRWRLTLRLRRPHGNLNPQGFDHELYLFEQGVRATGQVRAGGQDAPELLLERAGHPVDRLRQQVRDALYAQVDDRRAAGVLAALAVGDQSAIDREDWQVFRDTGVAHLMSISGLHVTMFAWAAAWLASQGWRRSSRAMLWVPAPVAARALGLCGAFGYALFAGWGVPAQRTVWMLAVVALLQSRGRRWPWPWVLVTAAVVVTALDPWAMLQAGFWLSFMAVGLLMASEPAHSHAVATAARRGRWRMWIAAASGGARTQVVATVGLAPLTLLCFQQISLVGLAANLIAIPLVTLLVTPLALAGAAWPPLWSVGAWLVQHMVAALQWLGHWPGAVWTVAAAPPWAQAAGLLAAALAVMPLPWRLRLLALPLALPLLFPSRALPGPGEFEVLAADVGQGTAVLVRTQAHLLVFDAGPQYSQEADAGQRILLPLLRSRGESRIDRLVLSHRDTDHVGGAAALFTGVPIGDLLSSLEPFHPLLERLPAGTPHQRCDAGQAWEWDGVQFEVLHPLASDHGRPLKPNAVSCVVRVSGHQGSALLTGDIERAQEARLVDSGAVAQTDILLVPHHGSKTSSTSAFLDAVRPRVAIVQAGHRNRFGHPAAEVMARYEARQIPVRDSASCGAWQWPTEGSSGFDGRCHRRTDLRYWRSAP